MIGCIWIRKVLEEVSVIGLSESEFLFLGFAFSDNCISWISCEIVAGETERDLDEVEDSWAYNWACWRRGWFWSEALRAESAWWKNGRFAGFLDRSTATGYVDGETVFMIFGGGEVFGSASWRRTFCFFLMMGRGSQIPDGVDSRGEFACWAGECGRTCWMCTAWDCPWWVLLRSRKVINLAFDHEQVPRSH